MGMLDFLKIAVGAKPPPKKKPPPGYKGGNNVIQVDSKSFPIATITSSGLVATGFDGSLIKGQNARVTISVDDSVGKFSFATTVVVAETSGDKLVVQFGMIPPETEALLKKYAQARKARGG